MNQLSCKCWMAELLYTSGNALPVRCMEGPTSCCVSAQHANLQTLAIIQQPGAGYGNEIIKERLQKVLAARECCPTAPGWAVGVPKQKVVRKRFGHNHTPASENSPIERSQQERKKRQEGNLATNHRLVPPPSIVVTSPRGLSEHPRQARRRPPLRIHLQSRSRGSPVRLLGLRLRRRTPYPPS